ncbi:MAG: urease accessory protein [Solirubrobacteraceae bacterium]|jgi:urease accessory protein|nr:urease accessory protein [Solirubrobacteraceae bacterium]
MRYAPALHVTRSAVLPAGSGPYDWMIHRRALPVVFLTCPLLGLSEPDELAVDVRLDGGTAAVVTTQGPASMLRTREVVRMHHRFRLGAGAHLTYLPWLTIPFPGSRAAVAHDVELAPGASFTAWDTMAVGRVARGERFALHELEARWRVCRDGEPLLDDRLRLRGADPVLAAAAFGGRTHLASVIVAGPDELVLPIELVRGMVADLDLVGVSRPVDDVLVVRALADSAERLEQALWPVIAVAHAAAAAPAFTPGDVARRWLGAGARGAAPAVRSAHPVLG